MLKRTPLFDVYRDYEGAKFIDFGGWELPVQFGAGIVAEHVCVRNNAGLFDVSHMGEILVEGHGAENFLDQLLTNRIRGMTVGRVVYSPMCYGNGGVVDDLLVYKMSEDRYLLVVNASNTDKDYEWITEKAPVMTDHRPVIVNVSDRYAQLALQGPDSEQYLSGVSDADMSDLRFFSFAENIRIAGKEVLVSRTGYTGEDGFEIYVAPDDAPAVWRTLMQRFGPAGLLPCGLGARDTLRFEAKLPLYGNEISESITPLEAGLSYFVDFEKNYFCGKEALILMKENGTPREIRGAEMIDKGVPRHGYSVLKDGKKIGTVTTGAKSITLDSFLALVLIERNVLRLGDECEIEINGNPKRARIVRTPFYNHTKGMEKE